MMNQTKQVECMSAQIIDGKVIAENLRSKIKNQVAKLAEKHVTPGLAVILVGDDPASEVYVKNKAKQTKEVGMNSIEFRMPAETSQKSLIAKIEHLNNDLKVHGILVQLPLPGHIDSKAVINAINPSKDVDGFHINSVGMLNTWQDCLEPCTPKGIMLLIESALGKDIKGKKAVVIGRSNIVGKPVATMLLKQGCTVTMTHSATVNIEEECRQADILVAAVGKPGLVKGSWIKPGACVIDVGINRNAEGKLVGDVDFESAKEVAGFITPVPGGVGPMTIACLLDNTLQAACKIKGINVPE